MTDSKSFVNTLPYISNPIEEFGSFKFVDWETGIYPKFKGGTKQREIDFFVDIIQKRGLRNILDFGVGGGLELSGIIKTLKKHGYLLESMEANEVDESFINLASKLFKQEQQKVLIHKANWLDLPKAEPSYTHRFDFGFLTGNSLTYIGGGTREYTKKAQQSIVTKFAGLIEKGGYIFIDSRNYDYIKSLMNLPKEEIFENFTFDYSVYYHGFQEKVLVFPAYISDTVVVLHYYDKDYKKWSKLDLYPIYQEDMLEILNKDFEVEDTYHDFTDGYKDKSLFVQYLARKR
ncbi:class I SAM-dependent methyltransferase [Candidatus Wolfebacteria bacterium]|nr:class I SAM-dependent methyltransferase [Candidatus Wolfebacteria bacterium]